MLRQIVPLTLLGLVLVPDWAAAFGRRRIFCRPPVAVAYCPPPVWYVPVCPPAYPVIPGYAPPQVRQELTVPHAAAPDMLAAPTVGEKPTDAGRAAGEPAKEPEARPVEFTAPAPGPSVPIAPPRPALPDAAPKPAVPEFNLTRPPAANPGKPAEVPLLPAPGLPTGPAAPPKDADGPKIPAVVPPLVPVPGSEFPPLAVPSPAAPPGPKSSTSNASPLAARPRVDVVPVDGPPPADPAAKRCVNFFNRTDRDVRLTVDGHTVTVPKQHAVTATVPARFAWRLDDGPAETTVVPTAAPGVEVVIRQ